MHEIIFREYDIRGKVGSELILSEVYQLGCAIAYYFMAMRPNCKCIVLCRDGRIDSTYISQELSRAFSDAGIDVVNIGVGPTPMMYFYLHTMQVDAGLMVTASHNDKEYNGIKICLGTASLRGTEIQEIKTIFMQKKQINALAKGSVVFADLFVHHYVTWLAEHFKHLKGNSTPVIFDLAGGAVCKVFPELLRLLQWQNVTLLNAELDPYFTAHAPDPSVAANVTQMKQLLLDRQSTENSCKYAIGFDGDGDRMAAMTSEGTLISGDKIIAAFAQSILQKQQGAMVVFDAKCSNHLSKLIAQFGGRSYMTLSGHSNIKYAMKNEKAVFGGELSCHFFFNDRYFGFDDGIYAALRLQELLMAGNTMEKIDTLFPETFATPEIRIFCAQVDKKHALNKAYTFFNVFPDVEISTIDGVRVETLYGWGLVRAANTQEALSLRFESDTREGLEHIVQDFQQALGSYVTISKLTGAADE